MEMRVSAAPACRSEALTDKTNSKKNTISRFMINLLI